jgi:hypothetical protein
VLAVPAGIVVHYADNKALAPLKWGIRNKGIINRSAFKLK